jgi:hypothetical protein
VAEFYQNDVNTRNDGGFAHRGGHHDFHGHIRGFRADRALSICRSFSGGYDPVAVSEADAYLQICAKQIEEVIGAGIGSPRSFINVVISATVSGCAMADCTPTRTRPCA